MREGHDVGVQLLLLVQKFFEVFGLHFKILFLVFVIPESSQHFVLGYFKQQQKMGLKFFLAKAVEDRLGEQTVAPDANHHLHRVSAEPHAFFKESDAG